ncbi:membrane protein insertase YidC [Pigmentiphaga sp. NML080357]|uniref:membrane protein insertase YidC n=1 Tax=Pigmentiphaga sp. NML080357 TaxID=2008675 RepID=UPI000B416518|nr:membrane protein insertase YidC [Pigmentiphaga sp. NML080357]OVZ55039.1 membrane protein insertase YidC [Pigmentiphaga sp. NML080357]
MDMQRTILWMIFSLSLLFLWDGWQKYNGHPSMFGSTPAKTATTQAPQNPPDQAGVPTAAPAGAPAAGTDAVPGSAPQAQQAQQAAPAEKVVVTTDVLRLTFDTVGAQIVKAELLKHADIEDRDRPTVLLDDSAQRVYLAQSGVIGAPNGASYPTHRTPFRVTTPARELNGDKLEISFEAESAGVKVTKTYTLHKGQYAIDVRHNLANVGTEPVSPSLYFQLTRDGNKPPGESHFYSTFTGPAVYTAEGKFQKVSFSDIEKGKASFTKSANDGWLGMIQHYFAVAWVPPEGVARTYDMSKVGANLYAVRAIEPVGTLAPGTGNTVDAKLWIGPQDQSAMAAVAQGLDLVVDYGWLTIIAKPLFLLMTWLHKMLGNWGWTIVALTVIIKAVFFPLSAAGYKSMARMKKVAPRMQALKEKFGDDRQKLNMAMMELYRTEKINPIGGCLPMIVQVPVFIALYWVLLASVEMRNAPWILWVHDLASPDPWFILPALMMATMFLQMKLNPTPPDPVQAKVMMIMPLVFGGMMFFFPAGLVLYWVVNNVLSIAQQWVVTRQATK